MGGAAGEGVDISLWGCENVGRKMGDWSILLHEMVCTCYLGQFLDKNPANIRP